MKFYLKILKLIAWLLGVSLVIWLMIIAAIYGFSLDFAGCFGEPSCKPYRGSLFVILPSAVLVLAGWGLYTLHKRKQQRYYQQLKQQVQREVAHTATTPPETVYRLIANNQPISLEDLQPLASYSQSQLLELIKQLLQQGRINQQVDAEGVTVFTANPS